ncbi:MAG: hypothetical protein PUI10_01915 [Prevotellaceae bacterium]|nr:hypothetical protein [Prevotellaceae bacterium]
MKAKNMKQPTGGRHSRFLDNRRASLQPQALYENNNKPITLPIFSTQWQFQ